MESCIDLKPEDLCFTADVKLAAAETQAAQRRFIGTAYGGGVITDHPCWSAVAFDLSGLSASVPMPLLLQHDSGNVIGMIDQLDNDGSQLVVGGKLFTGIDADADAVAAKADAGAPWQMSVGIYPDRIEEVSSATRVNLNSRAVDGPLSIFRSARVREVSFVALGADASTRATVFSSGGARLSVPVMRTTGEAMPDSTDTDQIAALTAERDALRARVAELEAKFTAQVRAAREKEVQALLGEQFTAEAAAPYLDMSDAQFAAVQALWHSMRAHLPPSFTVEQARAGAPSTITPETIDAYRRAHPQASYAEAFAALKQPNGMRMQTTFSG